MVLKKCLRNAKVKNLETKVFWLNFQRKNKIFRIDLPTVGLKTLTQCKSAGLKGIVLKSKQNVFLEQKKCINLLIKIKCLLQ